MYRTVLFTAAVLAPVAAFAAGANAYIQHNLVSDIPGLADVTDPNLVNPWGIAISGASPFWVSNQGKGNSTLYNGSGTITALVVTVPPASGTQAGTPTGQVNNATTTAFLIPSLNRAASFIFATEDGTISAWANGITGNVAAIMVNNSATAVYKGLAIGTSSTGPVLYATNFRASTIDVFDAKFAATKLAGSFTDANVPAGFAPFNIWQLGGKLYVTYAKQDAAKEDDEPGAGNGYVAVFDLDGNLVKHLVSGGALNAPWGVAIAPANFGAFGGALLVGNFGDGRVNAFDLNTGAQLGTLQDPSGKAIVIDGVWALIFGNGANGGDKNTLYFSAGIQGEQHGLLGSLAVPSTILGVQNGASQLSGSIAPGEVIVITGLSMGPSPTASASIPSAGTVGSNLGGASVVISGAPAPVLYIGASQASVVVPYNLGSAPVANIQIAYRGQTASLQVPAAAAAPGVFTLDFTGAGQATALNADGTINGASKPATAGSVITIFATGEGLTYPPGEDGVVNDRILRAPQQKVTLSIGGKDAQVIYAGTALGSVQGVMQVEALVPAGVTGTAPVVLTVGGVASQPNVTIAVK
jgi:uncharacterized protein (TIGR03118 family)